MNLSRSAAAFICTGLLLCGPLAFAQDRPNRLSLEDFLDSPGAACSYIYEALVGGFERALAPIPKYRFQVQDVKGAHHRAVKYYFENRDGDVGFTDVPVSMLPPGVLANIKWMGRASSVMIATRPLAAAHLVKAKASLSNLESIIMKEGIVSWSDYLIAANEFVAAASLEATGQTNLKVIYDMGRSNNFGILFLVLPTSVPVGIKTWNELSATNIKPRALGIETRFVEGTVLTPAQESARDDYYLNRNYDRRLEELRVASKSHESYLALQQQRNAVYQRKVTLSARLQNPVQKNILELTWFHLTHELGIPVRADFLIEALTAGSESDSIMPKVAKQVLSLSKRKSIVRNEIQLPKNLTEADVQGVVNLLLVELSRPF